MIVMRAMRNAALLPVLLLLVAACGDAVGPRGEVDLSREWTVVSPGEAGLDGAQLATAAAEAEAIPQMRSLLVARGGRLAFERYFGGADQGTLFDVRSVTKSIVATLVGIALAEGTLPDEDVQVVGWLDGFTTDAHDRTVTVRHLLSMTAGWQWDEWTGPSYAQWIGSPDHVQSVLDLPSADPAGTRFTYNSGAAHLLGFVLGRAAGSGLPAYARSRLFEPTGIDSEAWEGLEGATVNGGAGLDLTGRDLLRFGQLYLQRGRSGNRQVVPSSWIDEATTPQSGYSGPAGPMSSVRYGYLWWIWPAGGAYFAWGYGGQFVYVVPADELVVVATTEWRGILQGPSSGDLTPYELASAVLNVIVHSVLPAVAD